jgi:PQQ-like domain
MIGGRGSDVMKKCIGKGGAAAHRSRSFWQVAAPALLVAAVTACGGGGGSGGGGVDDGAANNTWLQFTPTTIDVQTFEGEATAFVVTARSSRTISEPLQVGIIDRQGVVAPGAQVLAVDQLTYEATLQTATSLAAGVYSGALEVRLCRDDPVICANPYPGSPWQVPYRINVAASTNLTPLTPLAGASNWTAYQGGAAHAGYVSGTINAAALGRRWVKSMGPNQQYLHPVVTDGGRVYAVATATSSALPPRVLTAVSEDDGSELWHQSFDSTAVDEMSPPTLAQGRVFVSTLSSEVGWVWRLRGFDAATGQAQLAVQTPTNGLSMPMGPTALGDGVYVPTDNGVARVSAADGTVAWTSALTHSGGFVTPAVDAQAVYLYRDNQFQVLNPSTGDVVSTVIDTEYVSNTAFMQSAPVLGAAGLVYATGYGSLADVYYGGRLLAFDVTAGRSAWTIVDRFRSNPVLTGDKLYIVNHRSLQARDAATGSLLWQWTPAGPDVLSTGPNTPLVVVGQHAFVAIDGKTFAVDLQTRQSVWTYPYVGPLAVSAQGVLYLVDNAGVVPRLHAINLR